jgi:hypothetical protein
MLKETETIDRLFLELSQFTTAKTNKELKYEIALNKLARLGMGDRLGNSDGNLIAQEALGIGRYDKNAKEALKDE